MASSGRRITIEFLGNASDLQDAVNDAGSDVEGFGGKLGKLGGIAKAGFAGLATAAAAGGAAVAAGLLTALDQEKATDKLAASLGATPKVAEKYAKAAGNLYAGAWGESMEEVTAAIGAVSSSFRGLGQGKDLERVTAQAMDFATIFEIDVPRATTVASTLIKQGLAKDATDAFDLMTRSAQKVPAALRENVLDAADEYGQFFSTIGFDGEQAFATLTAASAKGEFGIDKMGDAIKEFTILSTDMSESSKGAFRALGLDAKDMAAAMLEGGDKAGKATGQIIDGLLGMKDPVKQANTAIALFGTPLEDLNVRDIPEFLKSLKKGQKGLGDYEGAIDKAGATLNDNAATNFTSFKRQVSQTFVNLLGGTVIPKVSDFARTLATEAGPAIQKVGDWVRSDLMPAIRDLKPKLDAIVAAVRDNWPKIRETVMGVFNDVKSIVRDAVSIVQSLWKRFGANILQYAKSAFNNVRDVISGVFKVIKGIFRVFASALKGDWKGVWDGIKTIVKGAAQILKGIIGQLLNTIRFAFKNAWAAIRGIVSGAWDGIKTATRNGFSAVIDFIRSVPGRIADLHGRFAQAGRDLIGKFVDGLKGAGGLVSDIAGNIWGAVKGLLNDAISKVNAALEFKISLPGPDIFINPPNIPHLAKGGVVRARHGGTLALLGEAGHDEAVVPLSGPHAPRLGGMGGGNVYVTINGAVDPVSTAKQLEKILIIGQRSMSGPYQFRTAQG